MAELKTLLDRQIPVYDAEGAVTEATVTLPGAIFDVPLNIPLIHQVVEAQRAAARSGTASTKTRAEVSGGGRKPWRQKGTGRARQGSIRAPQWRGGGVVHGPKPRSYAQRTPKKMIAGALRSALSDRARNDAIYVFSSLAPAGRPSTKEAIATLRAVTEAPKVLVVLDRSQESAENAARSYRNVPGVTVVWVSHLNTYDVMNSDRVFFTEAALTSYVDRVSHTMNSRDRKVGKRGPEELDSHLVALAEEKADKTTESYAADHAESLAKTAAAEVKKAEEKA